MYGFTNEVTLVVDVNRNDPADHFFKEIELLLSSGRWSIPRSSDGTTYDESNLITDKSKIVANSWWVLESTSGQSYRFHVLDMNSTAMVRVTHSRAAGFTGGTPDATTPPTAADQQLILGVGTDGSPTGATMFGDTRTGLGAQARVMIGAVDQDSDAFFFTVQTITAGAAHSGHQFFCDPFVSPHADDDYPYWFCCASGTNGNPVAYQEASFENSEANIMGWSYFDDGAGTVTARKVSADNTGGSTPVSASTNPLTGLLELHAMYIRRPVTYAGATDEYTRGLSSIFLWAGQQTASPFTKTYASGAYINLGEDVVAGWIDEVPDGGALTYAGTWTDLGDVTVYTLGVLGDGGADTTSPTLTPTKASGTIRRHEALAYVAADNVAITNLTISIRYEGDDAPTVIYDGSRFWGRFHGVSTIVGDATEKTITLLPHGGWRRRIASIHFKVNDGNFAV